MLNANKPTQFYHFIMRTNHFNLEKVLTSNILVIYLYKQYMYSHTQSLALKVTFPTFLQLQK